MKDYQQLVMKTVEFCRQLNAREICATVGGYNAPISINGHMPDVTCWHDTQLVFSIVNESILSCSSTSQRWRAFSQWASTSGAELWIVVTEDIWEMARQKAVRMKINMVEFLCL